MSSIATALTQTKFALMLAEIVCPSDHPPLWHDGTAFITNGHTLFILDGVDQVVDWALWEGVCWANTQWESRAIASPETLKTFAAPTRDLPGFELPDIEPHPSWANPREMIEATCGECRGLGSVTCEYDHEHNCPECDGTGKIKDLRIDVEYHSKGNAQSRAIKTPAGHFQERYLWMVGRLAEHRTLTFGAFQDGLCFSFDGGAGAIMKVDIRH